MYESCTRLTYIYMHTYCTVLCDLGIVCCCWYFLSQRLNLSSPAQPIWPIYNDIFLMWKCIRGAKTSNSAHIWISLNYIICCLAFYFFLPSLSISLSLSHSLLYIPIFHFHILFVLATHVTAKHDPIAHRGKIIRNKKLFMRFWVYKCIHVCVMLSR